jgi:3-oxoacyl-[acyl-carrier protein] reductase
MTARFAGQVAFVTGAGVGIGYAICRALAHEGASVALNDVDGGLAHKAAAAINAEIGAERVVSYGGDVGDVSLIRDTVRDLVVRFGRLDVCVANAGITLFGAFLAYEPDTFDRVMGVNLRGTFFTAQAAARAMIEQGAAGRIVLMSSVTGHQAIAGLSAYGISKAGLRMMAKSLALELGAFNITVNAISPGATITERTLQETANYERDWAGVIPTTRAGTVGDVTAAVLFLCSPEARQVTGQTLAVDGGWTLYSPVPPGY